MTLAIRGSVKGTCETINALDVSALLCFLHGEAGHETLASALTAAVKSSVNWSEVLQKAIANGVNTVGMQEDLRALGL